MNVIKKNCNICCATKKRKKRSIVAIFVLALFLGRKDFFFRGCLQDRMELDSYYLSDRQY